MTSIPEWLKTDHPREVVEAAPASTGLSLQAGPAVPASRNSEATPDTTQCHEPADPMCPHWGWRVSAPSSPARSFGA